MKLALLLYQPQLCLEPSYTRVQRYQTLVKALHNTKKPYVVSASKTSTHNAETAAAAKRSISAV